MWRKSSSYDLHFHIFAKKDTAPRTARGFLYSAKQHHDRGCGPSQCPHGGVEFSVLPHSLRLFKIIWNFIHLFISLPLSSNIVDSFVGGTFIIYLVHTAHIFSTSMNSHMNVMGGFVRNGSKKLSDLSDHFLLDISVMLSQSTHNLRSTLKIQRVIS